MTPKEKAVHAGIGAFFREAGVLVGVFGNLDPIVHAGRVSVAWIAGSLGGALVLLLIGLSFEAKAAE
jgi:hypothetical protein